ncbi:leucine--tRNA ligase [Methanorbis furvi]|uniref:Leucine--tRNA ligase n=1 Tax=Methanorbis furvi TaxID=3028299 RepID=A0AAE4MES5_9EURY|nr:Valine--tRNA ligase [Methanocorpusculaceae archaeon Ag1]
MNDIEQEIRSTWIPAFESNPSEDKEKFYINVAFPYPSGAMHVGHGRTYIVPDIVARFWRMRGKQVLFPMAFHVTGAPVLGIAKRIAKKDEKTMQLYGGLYRVPQQTLDSFTDPIVIVNYFADEYERVMKQLGLSIDWRRRFTTIIPQYSKFIEWQYTHIYGQGKVQKGEYPVRYCPACDQPVGDHDLLEGDSAEVKHFVFVKYQFGEFFIPTATLRPETIFGVTNLWANPEVTYLKADVDGEKWIISTEAAEKLRMQKHTVTELGTIPGADLIDKAAQHPLTNAPVPILPASFVDPDMGSGLVMSVPAHAPFDYIALRDLQQQGKYQTIAPITLVTVPDYGKVPAQEIVEKNRIPNQDDPRMDELTQELYNAEFSKGKLNENCGVHAGKSVRQAREDVTNEFVDTRGSILFHEMSEKRVICRCGNRVYVKILDDQWFLNYADPEWKAEVHKQMPKIELVPPEVRAEFERTVDWLKEWPCTRRVGLGTRVPWDPKWLFEPLSDSTVYMSYYTIAHKITQIPAENLTPAVFDYIFLGKGDGHGLPVDAATLAELRSEFLYWYPYDYRFSAKDLISNHLTFQLFHHRAIFPDELQPKGMVVFGMGLLNGMKMSSSKGNVFLLEDAANEFGADTVRMFLVGSAEPWQDFDWRNELVLSVKRQIERMWQMVLDASSATGTAAIDAWLLSRLQHRIEAATKALAAFQTRQALQEAYNGIVSDLAWYRRRLPEGSNGTAVLAEVMSVWIRLMAPVIPYTAEKMWQETGHEGLVSFAAWPVADPAKINESVEVSEELLQRTIEDIQSILKLVQIEAKKVTLFTAPAWKHTVFSVVASAEDKRNVVKTVMADAELRTKGKDATDAAVQTVKLIHSLPPELVSSIAAGVDETAIFTAAKAFLEKESGLEVEIVAADATTHPKGKMALPFKPAIVVE